MRQRLLIKRIGARGLVLVFILLTALVPVYSRVLAITDPPPGPDRYAAIWVDFDSYRWWLVKYSDNQIACEVFADHEGLPTASEIYTGCGQEIYDAWRITPHCEQLEQGGNPSKCSGYYLHSVGSAPARKVVGIALPPAVAWLTLEDCTSTAATNLCTNQPVLVISGDEPLPNEEIIRTEGYLDGEPFSCGPVCELPLDVTYEDGVSLSFWVISSYGDTSPVFDALLRVATGSIDPDGSDQYYYVDVLSTQWVGGAVASCAQTWDAFPPVGGVPDWLATPEDPLALASNIPYQYLAKNLILQGMVSVRNCPDAGILPNGEVSPCGLDAALPAVQEWQNQFDVQIWEAAEETAVPAQLLKNLFSRESQFWPGIFAGVSEVGLGQMTENGADTTLLWNPSFYEQFCVLVLEDQACRRGYPHLKAEQQAMLRGALVRSVDAFCLDCPLGIDLRQADFSIEVFAETLMASCGQTGQIIRNLTNLSPGRVSSYEDLWRYTLVNYNAGPGCLSIALEETYNANQPLEWETVSANLTPVCEGAVDYVEDISGNP